MINCMSWIFYCIMWLHTFVASRFCFVLDQYFCVLPIVCSCVSHNFYQLETNIYIGKQRIVSKSKSRCGLVFRSNSILSIIAHILISNVLPISCRAKILPFTYLPMMKSMELLQSRKEAVHAGKIIRLVKQTRVNPLRNGVYFIQLSLGRCVS